MLNKLTAQKKVRGEDQYSPGGRTNARPNRASIVYANLCRQAFPGVPIVLGGIEASLRRIAHYDYWQDRIRRSLLLDAKADIEAKNRLGNTAWLLAASNGKVDKLRLLKDAGADIGIMAFVLQFAPQEFVNIPRLGTIQYHPSLLPKYRGPSSINWPIAVLNSKSTSRRRSKRSKVRIGISPT